MDKSVDTSGVRGQFWWNLVYGFASRSCNLVSVLSVPCRAILYVSSSAITVFGIL